MAPVRVGGRLRRADHGSCWLARRSPVGGGLPHCVSTGIECVNLSGESLQSRLETQRASAEWIQTPSDTQRTLPERVHTRYEDVHALSEGVKTPPDGFPTPPEWIQIRFECVQTSSDTLKIAENQWFGPESLVLPIFQSYFRLNRRASGTSPPSAINHTVDGSGTTSVMGVRR